MKHVKKRKGYVLVFVYGTLKKGFSNYPHYLEGKSALLGRHTTEAVYQFRNLGSFPGVELSGSTAVKGEVYQVGDGVMNMLDWLENYPKMYNRKEIDTEWGSAWMYYLNPNSNWTGRGEFIEDGIWR